MVNMGSTGACQATRITCLAPERQRCYTVWVICLFHEPIVYLLQLSYPKHYNLTMRVGLRLDLQQTVNLFTEQLPVSFFHAIMFDFLPFNGLGRKH